MQDIIVLKTLDIDNTNENNSFFIWLTPISRGN